MGDEDLEEAIAVREMSQKIKESCEGELMALSQRMGFLLEKPELEDDANPMSPSTVCAALRDACDQIEVGFKVRRTLMRQFELYAQEELHNVYHDLNSHLVERRILPDILPGGSTESRRSRSGPGPLPLKPLRRRQLRRPQFQRRPRLEPRVTFSAPWRNC